MSDLKPYELLKPLEKQAAFKAALDFKKNIDALQRAQREAQVPLFTICDVAVKTNTG